MMDGSEEARDLIWRHLYRLQFIVLVYYSKAAADNNMVRSHQIADIYPRPVYYTQYYIHVLK